jgi:hypothetical protein
MIRDKQKAYLIKIFVKKCTRLEESKKQLDYHFKLCEDAISISKEKAQEIKSKFSVDEYIKRIFPLIDKYFKSEDLKNIIKFYSTDAGQKLLNLNFMKEMAVVGEKMKEDVEKAFLANKE